MDTFTKIGSRLCKVGDVSVNNHLFGGRMLEWLAEEAAIYAMEQTGHPHLMGYRFSEVLLKRAVFPGEIVTFYGGAPRYGTTSITFAVEARVGAMTALTAECTFVAVDSSGQKTALTRL